MQAEVSLEFLKERNLSAKCNHADARVGAVSGKPEFSDIVAHGIALIDITNGATAFRQGILNADGGTKAQEKALVPLEKALDRRMRQLAGYVTKKAQEKDTLDEQISVIVLSGFTYNKVTRTAGSVPKRVTRFSMGTMDGVPGRTKIKSDSAGRNATYFSIFNRNPDALDAITYQGDQFTINSGGMIIHVCTDSRRKEVTLTSAEKWYGTRFASNQTGCGPASEKASVVTQ